MGVKVWAPTKSILSDQTIVTLVLCNFPKQEMMQSDGFIGPTGRNPKMFNIQSDRTNKIITNLHI